FATRPGPAQCGDLAQAVSYGYLRFDTQHLERGQTSQRCSCNAGLGCLCGNALCLRQIRPLIQAANGREAARPDAAAGVNRRSLSGEKKTYARAARIARLATI